MQTDSFSQPTSVTSCTSIAYPSDVIRTDLILDGAFVTSTDKVNYSCNNKEGLFTDLLQLFGIEESWIEFDDIISDLADGCWGSSNPCTSHILR